MPSRKGGELKLVRRIYADLERIHNVIPDASHHRAMVTAFSRRGQVAQALHIAQARSGDMGLREWVALVTRAAKDGDGEVLESVLDIAPPEDEVYSQLLAVLFGRDHSAQDVEEALKLIKSRITPGPWCEINRARLLYPTVEEALVVVESVEESSDERLRKAQLRTRAYVYGVNGDLSLVRANLSALREMGSDSPEATVLLVEDALSLGLNDNDAADVMRAVDQVQSDIGYDLTTESWAAVVAHVLAKGSLRTAWDVYCLARKRTEIATAELADAFVDKFAASTPPRLDEAMEVYQDLMNAHLNHSTAPPSAKLYTNLLNACLASNPPRGDLVVKLATDMEQNSVQLKPDVVTEAINVLMQTADYHSEAFKTYAQLRNVTERFSESQYNSIITNFIALSYPDSSVAPPQFVMQMMQDMRAAGYKPGSRILTALLTTYAALGKKARKMSKASPTQNFQVAALLHAIRDIHALINLDPVVSIDVPLLSSLMDAFSSAGAFADAFEVWDELVRLQPTIPKDQAHLYSPAVSVIIDTCGQAEYLPRARRIWGWATRRGLNSDDRTWAAWVECLCRVGKIDEATDVVCAMQNPPATREIARIVAKFSWRYPRQMGAIVERLGERYPQWKGHLEGIVATK